MTSREPTTDGETEVAEVETVLAREAKTAEETEATEDSTADLSATTTRTTTDLALTKIELTETARRREGTSGKPAITAGEETTTSR